MNTYYLSILNLMVNQYNYEYNYNSLEYDYSSLNCLTFLKFEKSMSKTNINNYFLTDLSVGRVHTM